MAADPPKKLIVVGGMDRPRELQCGVCGAGFAKHEMSKYDRHMARCANSEEAHRMEQHSPRNQFPFLRADFGDFEYAQWVKQHARALAERRMKM